MWLSNFSLKREVKFSNKNRKSKVLADQIMRISQIILRDLVMPLAGLLCQTEEIGFWPDFQNLPHFALFFNITQT